MVEIAERVILLESGEFFRGERGEVHRSILALFGDFGDGLWYNEDIKERDMENEQAKKSMKPILIGAAVILVIAGIVWFVVGRKGGEESGNSETTSSTTENGAKVTANELENVAEISVTYGDFEKMQTVAKQIQNGELTGKIVSIDGVVSRPGTSYSIVEESEDKSKKIGTVFTIQDAEEYPEDGVRVSIKAKVVEKETLVYQLVTLKDYIKEKMVD